MKVTIKLTKDEARVIIDKLIRELSKGGYTDNVELTIDMTNAEKEIVEEKTKRKPRVG